VQACGAAPTPRIGTRSHGSGVRQWVANPVGDTTPCECAAVLARQGPRPRRVARPRAECQRPRGAFVRAIREECLNRLILFGERRLCRASMRPGARTSGAELSGLGNEGRSGLATDPGRARDSPPMGPRGRLSPRLVCLPDDLGGSSTGSASSRSGRRPVRARSRGGATASPSADSTGGSSGAGARRQDGV
jgi:hypothetical protein